MRTILCFIASLCLAAGIVTGVRYASADETPHVVTVPAFIEAGAPDAGSASAPALASSVVIVTPAPAAAPQAPEPPSVDSITKAWKGGAFVAAGILALYLLLGVWVKIDKRHALYIAAGLGAIGMLVEAASRGETPTFGQLFGAVTVFMAILSKGPAAIPKQAPRP